MPDAAPIEGKALLGPPNYTAILERYGGRRGGHLLAAVAAAQILSPMAKAAHARLRRKEDFTITVPGPDDIYPDLHEWVLERIPESERKAMVATTQLGKYDELHEHFSERLRLRYDGSRVQTVTIDGHKIRVAVEREDIPERANLPEDWRQYMEKITFTATTAAGRDAVVHMMIGLIEAREKQAKPPALFMPSRWGGEWIQRGDLPQRTLESTILKEGQLDRLVGDLQAFLDAEEEYNRLSQPWHRGYIFYGPPGTGKTSVARALANHFGLNAYYLPLGDIDKDANLVQHVAAIKPRSVLLLEDIDVFQAATERTDEKDKASVGAMLNALDGIWTPHGLITVMTTNNREALDDALIRAGRIDMDEEFSNLDLLQACRIAHFFGWTTEQFPAERWVGRAPAELTEFLKTNKPPEEEQCRDAAASRSLST